MMLRKHTKDLTNWMVFMTKLNMKLMSLHIKTNKSSAAKNKADLTTMPPNVKLIFKNTQRVK